MVVESDGKRLGKIESDSSRARRTQPVLNIMLPCKQTNNVTRKCRLKKAERKQVVPNRYFQCLLGKMQEYIWYSTNIIAINSVKNVTI